MIKQIHRSRLLVFLALVILLVVTACGQQATIAPDEDARLGTQSHFRSTQLTWSLVPGTTTTVEFKASIGLRASFYSSPAVGTTIFVASTVFGDGNSANPPYTVTFVDTANDWLIAESTHTHAYAGPGPYSVFTQTCCRLGVPSHINNPDGFARAETVVNLTATTASPVSSISPIVDCPKNAVCTFAVPASDPDGQGMQFRLATGPEAAGGTFTQPPGATVDPATGNYSWDTTGAQLAPSGYDTLYSTQVMVDNVAGGSVVTKTPVDFFIRLSDQASTNEPPVFESPTPADGTTINATLGDPVTFDVQATDPDSGDTVTLAIQNKPSSATFAPTAANPATGTFAWTPTSAGTVILTLSAQDQLGLGATQRSITIDATEPVNQPPSADAGGPYTGSEGSPIALSGSATDGDGDSLTYNWSYTAGTVDAGATCSFSDATVLNPTFTCTDDGDFTVALVANDATINSNPSSATITVSNVAPSVDAITPSATEPIAVNTSVSISAPFSDAGTNDTHTASVDWDDGSIETGTASAGLASDDHVYTVAGVYSVQLTVTDDDGDSASALYQYVVAYDPDDGFVTGGGWIDSGSGAYTPDDPSDADIMGRATFGFVSKYKKGARTPTGNTQFQFQAGDLNFHSNLYQWLVITQRDTMAQYKGSGTINGQSAPEGDYKFVIWAGDNTTDTFRIRIWWEDAAAVEHVMYDNGVDQAIGGGSIKIHKR